MQTPEQEQKCRLCDSHATAVGNQSLKTTEYDCVACGRYSFDDRLLWQMSSSQHWEQTRKDLASALQKGVVSNRHFETEQDIGMAIG